MTELHERINCPYAERIGEDGASIKGIKESLDRIEAKVDKQNGRVRKLENWRAYTIGIAAVLMFIIDLVVKRFIN